MVRINEHIIHIGSQEIFRRAHFYYLGSIIHENGEIEEDVL